MGYWWGDSGSTVLWWVGAGLYRCVWGGGEKERGENCIAQCYMIEAKHNDRCIKVANMAQWGEIHGRVLWGCACVCGGACGGCGDNGSRKERGFCFFLTMRREERSPSLSQKKPKKKEKVCARRVALDLIVE